MGKNDALLIGGALVGLYVLSQKSEDGGLELNLGGLGSGILPEFDFSGLLGNLGAGIGNLFTGIGQGLANIQVPTFTQYQSPTGGGAGYVPTQFPTVIQTGLLDSTYLNPTGSQVTDLGNTFTQVVQSAVKGGLIGTGIYLGSKAALPIINAVSPSIGTALRTPVSQVVSGVGRSVGSVAQGTGKIASTLANRTASILTSPVSKIATSPLTKIGVVGAAIGAGAAGYAVGSWFNTTPAGQTLIQKSGDLGAQFGQSSIGQKIYGVATVNEQKVSDAFGKIGLTTSQVQSLLKQGYSPQQIVTGAYKN